MKKDPTTSNRKYSNELKLFEKTLRIAIKKNLSPGFNPLDYVIQSFLGNKVNATPDPNIGSLKTAIEKEWNKMTEEFILNAWKSFRRHAVRNGDHIVQIYCFKSIVIFFSIKINLVHYYTRIFIILFLHPAWVT